ncbi:MAG: YgiQ family radical SAM protein [Anaeroplasmataceae bacterium]
MAFLPITLEEMKDRGWTQPDFIYITGDAYIDHPSFGCAIITRILENFGYTSCIVSQPDINKDSDFTLFGKPRLAFIVSSGNIDSMVNHYTVSKRLRSKDYYTPNGEMGKRPDRALIRYCNKLKQLFPDVDVIIGGIEASLRRLSHYDYWDDRVMPSVLVDSKADLLLYGMGEKTIVQVADALDGGLKAKDIIYIRNSCYITKDESHLPYKHIMLPSFNEAKTNRFKYVESFKLQYENTDPYNGLPLVEKYKDFYLVQNAPEFPLTKEEMDMTYALPYMRKCHPLIEAKGHVPAIDEVQFSIIANRGCYGGCNFCALTFHQGRIIQSRTKESIVDEAKIISKMDNFKGYIHDIGGPSANFYDPACDKQLEHGVCKNKRCLSFKPCNNLKVDHSAYLDILKTVRNLDGIKKVFVRSGIRYDYVMYDRNKEFLEELVKHHISGQLKVAPEHIDDAVLEKMGKPSKELYDQFTALYKKLNVKNDKDQYLVPYLMSSHPGSTIHSAIKLAEYLKEIGYTPEQVQDFYPTPGTASTCMFYTGIDPFTNKEVYVPKKSHEKAMQRALLQFKNPKNYDLVFEALTLAKREDLIGHDKKCLIKPRGASIEKFNSRHKR